MSTAKPTFLTNVHLCRGVAIALVVATHVLFELPWPRELLWEYKLCLSLVQNGTVPFVFISGLLFQHRLPKFEYARYLDSKLRYVVVPYVLVSLPYLWLQWQRRFGVFSESHMAELHHPVLDTAVMFLSGRQMPVPLWFVPMMCVLYLLAPVFARADRHPKSYALLPGLLLLASFAHRPEQQHHLSHSILYFLPVYFAGMCVGHYREHVMTLAHRQRWPLVLLVLASVVFEVLTRERPGAIESAAAFSIERGVFDVNLYQKLILSVLLLEALRHTGSGVARVLDPIARVSFGIFFTHYYVLYFARDILRSAGSQWPAGMSSVAILAATTVALCTALSLSVQRVFGKRSRYLIGC
jgi:probable poly-beta-1,6-N-acetyl-D-glucosamine export protein